MIEILKNAMLQANSIFPIRFRLLDQRDAVSWVEMDHWQKEWSNEVNMERYLS